MKQKIIIAIAAALSCGAALAEVDQNGCRNTASKGYVCKAQKSETWERKARQAKRQKERKTSKTAPPYLLR